MHSAFPRSAKHSPCPPHKWCVVGSLGHVTSQWSPVQESWHMHTAAPLPSCSQVPENQYNRKKTLVLIKFFIVVPHTINIDKYRFVCIQQSTFIRARIVLMLSVLEVTQRVPPTCTTKTDVTYRGGCSPRGRPIGRTLPQKRARRSGTWAR
jgi:hypothetical protein